jgi:hypothetical protein
MSQLQSNIDFALAKHPAPWKVRQRKSGARMRASHPWEVVDANEQPVALVTSGQAGCLLAAAIRDGDCQPDEAAQIVARNGRFD